MRQALITLGLLPLLAACADFPGAGLGSSPPDASPSPEPRFEERDARSFESEQFFQRVEDGLVVRGLLRDDGGGPDAPFTSEMLARNFLDLAFSQEFSDVGGRMVQRPTDSALHRWQEPVRLQIYAGPSVDADRAASDRQEVARLALRLERATSHPVNVVSRNGNFHVLLLNDQELRRSGALLKGLIPGISSAETDFVENMPRETYCVVFASDPENKSVYSRAVAIIRAELPDRLRASCIHEEIAQGLGLANDSARARPSIFNDDDEYGRLTTHDELLLEMLYDRRIAPGMTKSEAAPTVRLIAETLTSPTT
ncbi:MAG: DUF2927 domain-containing protein [Boseongicola sp.]|nr:DUF2927 domain-containing protein [Boseongicola sp.]MDD9978070.1 DUF2927 domain-containing protein [Boseongicola sp.]